MIRKDVTPTIPSKPGQPAWELAQQFPMQGDWTENEYLALSDRLLIEFVDGTLEFLPMPTERHQRMVLFLLRLLLSFVEPRGSGTALMAPLRVRVREGKYREPDLVFMLAEHAGRRSDQYWEGADLVMEVVSSDDPQRDRVVKRADYAGAGISEYWIVDPDEASISVLVLEGPGKYREEGIYRDGDIAPSRLLQGFQVDVGAVMRS